MPLNPVALRNANYDPIVSAHVGRKRSGEPITPPEKRAKLSDFSQYFENILNGWKFPLKTFPYAFKAESPIRSTFYFDVCVLRTFVADLDQTLHIRLPKAEAEGNLSEILNVYKTNYCRANQLQIPCLKLINSATIQQDGFLVTENKGVPFDLDWEASTPFNELTKRQQDQIKQIADIFKVCYNKRFYLNLRPNRLVFDTTEEKILVADLNESAVCQLTNKESDQECLRKMSQQVELFAKGNWDIYKQLIPFNTDLIL